MLFVIDIGNTHSVSGLYDGNQLHRQWRIKTDPAMTADELAATYFNLFAMTTVDINSIDGVILASVVPQLNAAYLSCCRKMFFTTRPERMYCVDNHTVAELITIRLDHPEEVGADRLVNGIAAYHVCNKGVIVIDFGTAITFDCVSQHGEYLGGLILPGMNLALGALARNTAKLPQIDISTPPSQIIGTNTVSAMKSGMLFGYGAMIEGLIDNVRKEMVRMGHQEIKVIATGGMSSVIRPFTPSIQRYEPNLTLDGLALIYHRLAKSSS